MLIQLIGGAVLLTLFAAAAHAQVAGDAPRSGVGGAVERSGNLRNMVRSHSLDGSSESMSLEERQYRATVNRIPDRKPSSDPWNSIRARPAVAPVADRHRVQ